MSHKTKPTPRQSAAQRGPKVVTTHDGNHSVGTKISRKGFTYTDPHNEDAGAPPNGDTPPTILSRDNGKAIGRGQPAGGARAPGSLGPAQTGPYGASSW
jgi:hypothetical protein